MKKIITFVIKIVILSLFTSSINAKDIFNTGFIENKGQIIDQNNLPNPTVKYLWTGNGMKVQLKANSFSYEVLKYENQPRKRALPPSLLKDTKYGKVIDSTILNSHRIDIELLGANPNPKLKSEGHSEDYLNYYTTGTPEAGVTYVHHYNKVTYQNIYPNIDLEFVLDATNKQPFKYNFIVHPNGRVSDIQLQYKGANSTNLTQAGNLNIATAYGNFEENIPRSYVAETGKDITVHYQQNREGVYMFNAENYNPHQTLVIDPWCTYFGWDFSQNQGQTGIASLVSDSFRNIYTSGSVDIVSNVATTGAFQTTYGGGIVDAFIRKFNGNGFPVWSTYYGGSSDDRGASIICDELSNIYITGPTWSSNNIATSGSFLSILPVTAWTSFLSKFNTNGLRIWGTYYPANSYKVIKDHSNNIIIGGYADDTNAVTLGAHQTTQGGGGDDFIAMFTPIGQRLWGTFYGGSGIENTTVDIAIDSQNNIYLSGTTESPNNISSSGSFQQNYAGGYDNFIVKFNSNGIRQWGTYYGGAEEESHFTSITCDANGNIYFSGEAQSPNVFATSGAFQMGTSTWGGDYCLAKFNTNGQRIWSTYFDGNNEDWVYDLKIDSYGNAVFVGSTLSTNIIATSGSLQPNFSSGAPGAQDGFIEKFSPSGVRIWGTYFGGIGDESIATLSIDKGDNIIIGGLTASSGLATQGAYQNTIINGGDIFLASLDSNGTFTTGFGEVANPRASLLQVYPNPTKDKIVVHLKGYTGKEGSLKLQTIEGKLLKQCSVKAEETSIDLKELAIGVYLLEYSDGEVCETVKVVKE